MPMRGDRFGRWPLATRPRIGRTQLPYVASGMGHLFASDDARPATTQPSLLERGVPELGGTGLEWFAGVKRAEVETAVALPGSGAVHCAMPVVELVISPSNAGHECSRSINAFRAALRGDRAFLVAPPILSGLSVDEHADLLAKAARVAWRRAAPRVQVASQADWMDEEAWQAVRAHAAARRVHQKVGGFLPLSLAQEILFAVEACYAASCGGETIGAVARLERVGQDQSSDCVVSLRHVLWCAS